MTQTINRHGLRTLTKEVLGEMLREAQAGDLTTAKARRIKVISKKLDLAAIIHEVINTHECIDCQSPISAEQYVTIGRCKFCEEDAIAENKRLDDLYAPIDWAKYCD